MLLNSRRLLAFRKSIVKLLTQQMGYKYQNMRQRAKETPDLQAWTGGPEVSFLHYSYLEMINTGRSHDRVDYPASVMEHLGDRQLRAQHFNTEEQPLNEARVEMFDLLLCGYEFEVKRGQYGYNRRQGGRQFGTVQYINWLQPEANHFRVHECWRGVTGGDEAWDMVLCINGIPLVGVMTAPTTSGHRPCEEAYQQMRRLLDADPRFSTYCLLCLISDGKTTLVGSPDDPPEWFLPWEVLPHERQLADEQNIPERLHPFFAVLSRQSLINYIRHFVRLVNDGHICYAAHSHQIHAIMAAAAHLAQGHGPAYALLPQADEALRSYPFETNYQTTRLLFAEYLQLANLKVDEDEKREATVRFEVEQPMSITPLEGECIYRPHKMLYSPLADD